jgi:hypothetical protein
VTAGIPALHAAVIDPGMFKSVEVKNCLETWESAVTEPDKGGFLAHTVHGALQIYDLPDPVRDLQDRKLISKAQ